jgi:hypothetical protein
VIIYTTDRSTHRRQLRSQPVLLTKEEHAQTRPKQYKDPHTRTVPLEDEAGVGPQRPVHRNLQRVPERPR